MHKTQYTVKTDHHKINVMLVWLRNSVEAKVIISECWVAVKKKGHAQIPKSTPPKDFNTRKAKTVFYIRSI